MTNSNKKHDNRYLTALRSIFSEYERRHASERIKAGITRKKQLKNKNHE